ncbi:MAG: DUF3006 domain-containing protein [Firmicutes bacterium]|nr:DUF3006 domain-containing protein [Bacillota bacterium]
MRETYVVDRFEGGYAVCEDIATLETINVPRDRLPGAKAGDVIIRKTGGFEIDRARTAAREQRIGRLFEKLKAAGSNRKLSNR